MSRVHYFSFLVDDHGHPLSGAEVSIFLAGSETPAKVFDTEFGSEFTSEIPQVITNTKGFFEFWLSDTESPDGYSYGQKFKIVWEKSGISSGFIDWIDIFPNIYPVDETNFGSDVKNKLISDRLAFNWEIHSNHDVRTDFFPIHGLEPFNPIGDGDTIQGTFTPDHEQINKIISDKYAYIWNNHSEFSFEDLIDSSSHITSSGSPVSSGDFSSNPDTYNTTAHGLEPAKFNDDDIYYNRLVSNEFMTNFVSRDGIQSFTHPVSGIYPTNENHLTTKEYVDDIDEYSQLERFKKTTNKKTFIINKNDWILKQNNEYYYIIEHGFNEEFPNVIIWNNYNEIVDNNYNITSLNFQQLIIYSNSKENLSVIVDNNIAEPSKISQRKFEIEDFELLDDKYFITIEYNTDQPYPFVQIWDYENRTINNDGIVYKNPIEDDKLTIKFDAPLECIININNILNANNRKTIDKDVEQNTIIYFDINSWDYDGSIYSKTINHNSNRLYPSVTTWDTDTNLVVFLTDIESIDENTIKLYSETPLNIKLSVDDGEYNSFEVLDSEWLYNSWGGFYYTLLRHDLNTLYTNISTWNTDTNKIEYLSKVSILDYNTILLHSDNPINLNINVQYPEYSERIDELYWTQTGPDSYEYFVHHNKNIEYPFYSIWNVTAKKEEEFENIKNVEYIDENIIKVTVHEPIDGIVNVNNGFVIPIYEVLDPIPNDTISIIETDWTFSNNLYLKEIQHNLNTLTPHLYIWDIDLDRIISIHEIRIIDNNRLLIYSLQPNNLLISFENNFGDFHNYFNYLMNTKLDKRGDKMNGVLDMVGNSINNLPLPIYPDEAVNKLYVDTNISDLIDNINSFTGITSGYIPDPTANYINTANTFFEADQLLDDQIKTNEDDIAQEITNRSNADTNIQNELDNTQLKAGLATNGNYITDTTANYINTANTLFEADQLLDDQIKTNEDDIAQEITNRSNADINIQNELDNTQLKAGLAANGNYITDTTANYINTASTLFEADQLLDDQIKTNEDNIDILLSHDNTYHSTNYADELIIITAGNGLTGGGNLTTNRTFNIGTPSTIGSGSSNSVTAGSHNHAVSLNAADIPNLDASKITTGIFDLDRIPHAALERLHIVADEIARYALTTTSVQNGDTVKQTDTGLMYFVIDDTNLNNSSGYEIYLAGTAASVAWTGITGKPTTFNPTVHDNTYHSDINQALLTTSNVTFNTVTASLSGNATTATALQTARTINGVSFNGSANIVIEPYISNDDTGDTNCPIIFSATTTAGYKRLYEDSALYFDNTNNRLYSPWFYGSLSGNASTATTATNCSRSVIAGTGLSGGGALTANRTLSVDYGTTAGTACQGNDSRLSNDRTPVIHDRNLHSDINQALLTTSNVIHNRITATEYVFGQYMNMSHAVSTRNADTVFYSSTDDYIRKNNAAGFRNSLGLDGRYLGISAKAADADKLDGLDSSQFLRSDVDDTQTSNLTVNGVLSVRNAIDLADNDIIRFGSGDDCELFCNGSHMYMDLNAGIGNFYIRDGSTTRFTFNDAGHFTATGTITATAVYNAVYNDLAEFRPLADNEQLKPGYCYYKAEEGLKLTTEKCQMAVIGICSDTYGFALGKKDNSVPIGISGWVLAKTDKEYPSGTPLTCDKEGILTEMTMDQKMYYPERLIAVMDSIVTEEYLTFDDNVIEVNNRHWVKIK